ncbi:hypothetical protein CSHISOI_08544 [Colletotrichum shisoi]|uniref:Uncharacterized protein n=1 Tax=Colletotrichum shisoi TaxID=2078593 RepID=A0A5Q4BIX6_9PEZI|nr:hypothetical protein CSHISOI_08544 [Colletotrichum shisoi]
MTGALLGSQPPPRIEELGRQDRCSSASTGTASTNASISTRSPPLYYGATPLVAGDDRRMNPQQLAKVPYEHNSNASLSTIEGPSQQPTALLNLFNPPITNATSYSPEGGFYHTAASQIFPSLDVRPRLGSK